MQQWKITWQEIWCWSLISRCCSKGLSVYFWIKNSLPSQPKILFGNSLRKERFRITFTAMLNAMLNLSLIRHTYRGIATWLQLNGHVTGANRHAYRWWLRISRTGNCWPQCGQSSGLISQVAKCWSSCPRTTTRPQPVCVHGTGSWRHWSLWFVCISRAPVHAHPDWFRGQKACIDSTTLSKAMMSLKSEVWRDCLPTGQLLLLWTLIHCSMQVLQNRWPSLHATASFMMYLL